MQWKIIDTGPASAEDNMEWDRKLLENLEEEKDPVLHLYQWQEESATYGYFAKPEELLNMEGIARRGVDLARRPTGGGVVFHICDLAFSVAVPSSHPAFSLNTLQNYAFVNQGVIGAVQKFTGKQMPNLLPNEPTPLDAASRYFCMAKPTKFDVMVGGLKVGGAAQRRRRQGFLHQGTISIAMLPDEELMELLAPGSRVLEAMKANSYSLLPANWTKKELEEARREVQDLLAAEYQAMDLDQVCSSQSCPEARL